jgi:hypothetical protein
MKKTLHLNLKRKWFDMIKSGEKKEEYRDITPYWCSKFLLFNGKHESRKFWNNLYLFSDDGVSLWSLISLRLQLKNGHVSFKHYDTITFSNGMTPPVPRFGIDKKGISIGEGNPDLGAVPGKKYFVLELGEIL